MSFGDAVADPADQKRRRMPLGWMGAGDKGVQTFDAVGKSIANQKVKGPVRDRRLRILTIVAQAVEDLVGPHRPVFGQQNLQDAPTHWSELQSRFFAGRFDSCDAVRDTGMVVVDGKSDSIQGRCP